LPREARESLQNKLGRVRLPRVQITYDVEAGAAVERRELPFEAGTLADLSENAQQQRTPLRERKFLDIDFDNFDDVLKRISPRLTYVVDKVGEPQRQLTVDLSFERIEDFEPGNIAAQIAPLNTLLEARQQLASLLVAMDGKDGTEELLANLLQAKAV
jgi:type VI secretion system protein ImpB